jgi:hypothetical protein
MASLCVLHFSHSFIRRALLLIVALQRMFCPSRACSVPPVEARARTRQYVRDQREITGSFIPAHRQANDGAKEPGQRRDRLER